MGDVKTRCYIFEVREITTREAEVTAGSLKEARALMAEWLSKSGRQNLADMGGDAPIQLTDLETEKVSFRHLDSLTRYSPE